MKVKTFLALFIIIVIVGLVSSIVYSTFQSDTDIIKESFYETLDVISVRQHPNSNKLFIIVYEYYDPICGCYEEVSIFVNPHEYKSEIENLNLPKTIIMRGIKVNSVYNIEYMEIKYD